MDINKTLEDIVEHGNEYQMLKALQVKLARTIDASTSGRDIAALSRQLLLITDELAAYEGDTDIDELLERRKSEGRPGAVRSGLKRLDGKA